MRMLGYFQNKKSKKLHTIGSLDFFSLQPRPAQNNPRLEIHIGNVSQDTSHSAPTEGVMHLFDQNW